MLGDGPEYTLDTASEFIVCCNYLGSPYGSASPVTEDPVKRAKGGLPGYCPYGGRFPDLTLRDQARTPAAGHAQRQRTHRRDVLAGSNAAPRYTATWISSEGTWHDCGPQGMGVRRFNRTKSTPPRLLTD